MRNAIDPVSMTASQRRIVFVACFLSLVATSMAFGVRISILDELVPSFGLSETQRGEIFGAGLWPFAISIVLFSLIIDRIGFGWSMVFALLCHLGSAFITIAADGFWMLYVGAFVCALANGTVEAVINPVVASMYPKAKTKWLTILHAGWPLGIALGMGLTLVLPKDSVANVMDWQIDVALLLVPAVLYGVLMFKCDWPMSERVAAGVSYKAMLREVGFLGACIIGLMVFAELTKVGYQVAGHLPPGLPTQLITAAALTLIIAIPFGLYTRSFGRPLFILLLMLMIPLAITELGTDSWIKALLSEVTAAFNLNSGWVLVYTASIMIVMRFLIGPIVKVFNPLGILAMSSLFAVVGIYLLSSMTLPVALLIAATIYGIGQAFFWPCTLGVVAEQFPKGGALTLNTVAAVGMLGVGIIGSPFLGNLQDSQIDRQLATNEGLYRSLMAEDEKLSVFGQYRSVEASRLARLRGRIVLYESRPTESGAFDAEGVVIDPAYLAQVETVFQALKPAANDVTDTAYSTAVAGTVTDRLQYLQLRGMLIDEAAYAMLKPDYDTYETLVGEAKRRALAIAAIPPVFMLLVYLGLLLFFKVKGGYQPVLLLDEEQLDASESASV